jgi:hypothetical protein
MHFIKNLNQYKIYDEQIIETSHIGMLWCLRDGTSFS